MYQKVTSVVSITYAVHQAMYSELVTSNVERSYEVNFSCVYKAVEWSDVKNADYGLTAD